MYNKLLDGKLLSNTILQELKYEILQIKQFKSIDSVPKLAYIYMGSNPSVVTYLGIKRRSAELIGVNTEGFYFPDHTNSSVIIDLIKILNKDASVSGILIQLPLTVNSPVQDIIDSVDVSKDVDGLHSFNMGKLALRGCEPLYYPCTPAGCAEILNRYSIDVHGKHAVILGRSNLAGTPLSLMLQKLNATVTLCHKSSENIKNIIKSADILAVAIGKPYYITEDMVKPGVVILDIGINNLDGKIVGDVHPNAHNLSSFFTPVPGGIGPMTVSMLMKNLVKAWKLTLT
jgi:methylenetetrahydrofolate dehydrogenase (NADP+) / methenyltetrahydrofolate cyclohydrolase